MHTGFINDQSDACPLPKLVAPEAKTVANAMPEAVSALVTALDDWQRVVAPPAELRGMIAEGLALLREVGDTDKAAAM